MESIVLDRQTLEKWAGRRLTDDEVRKMQQAVPDSGIPESIHMIAWVLKDGEHQ